MILKLRQQFRDLQVELYHIAERGDQTEMMRHQDRIELWVRDQIDVAIIRATDGMGTMPGVWMSSPLPGRALTREQIVDLRTLQADGLIIASMDNVQMWIKKQHEIESWVAKEIDEAAMKAVQHLIQVAQQN